MLVNPGSSGDGTVLTVRNGRVSWASRCALCAVDPMYERILLSKEKCNLIGYGDCQGQ
jgi:hypothetical protein